MLAAVPGLVRFADPPDSNDKHMPFFARESEVAGKLLVMNIRRLPAWAAERRSAQGPPRSLPRLPAAAAREPDEMTSNTDADDLLRWMTDHGRFVVDRWLRAEALEEDVLALLDELGELTGRVERRFSASAASTRAATTTSSSAVHADQIAGLLRAQPDWAEIERRSTAPCRSTDGGSGRCRSAGHQTAIGAYSSGKAEPPKNQFSIA